MLRFLGLRRYTTHDPPSKVELWIFALLSAFGLALMLMTTHGLLHALAVGLFGGGLGAWLNGRKKREDAGRAGLLDPN